MIAMNDQSLVWLKFGEFADTFHQILFIQSLILANILLMFLDRFYATKLISMQFAELKPHQSFVAYSTF